MRREMVSFRTSQEEGVAAEVAGGTASLDLSFFDIQLS